MTYDESTNLAKTFEREAMALTRPHPRAANLIAGWPLAIFDRIRNAVRGLAER